MAAKDGSDVILAKIQKELAGTVYECSSYTPLSGGSANFIYKGILARALPSGVHEVVIKHAEAYVASSKSFQLPTSRCRFEEACLQFVAGLAPSVSDACTVRTPKLYHHNEETNTQVQEYLPNAVDLKNYALKHFAAPTSPQSEAQCVELGRGLGRWLRDFHDWADLPEQSKLRETIAGNEQMRTLKHLINYIYLGQTVERFPRLLDDAKDTFEEVRQMAEAELEDSSHLHALHGDFWTGNTLLPDKPIEGGSNTPIFIIDWELAHLGVRAVDIGQMVAEMYELKLFKDNDAGIWLVEGFASGYGELDDVSAFRTIIHIGTHLVCFGSRVPGWGTSERVEQVIGLGKDLVVRGFRKDSRFFEKHFLSCLFSAAPAKASSF